MLIVLKHYFKYCEVRLRHYDSIKSSKLDFKNVVFCQQHILRQIAAPDVEANALHETTKAVIDKLNSQQPAPDASTKQSITKKFKQPPPWL